MGLMESSDKTYTTIDEKYTILLNKYNDLEKELKSSNENVEVKDKSVESDKISKQIDEINAEMKNIKIEDTDFKEVISKNIEEFKMTLVNIEERFGVREENSSNKIKSDLEAHTTSTNDEI